MNITEALSKGSGCCTREQWAPTAFAKGTAIGDKWGPWLTVYDYPEDDGIKALLFSVEQTWGYDGWLPYVPE